MEMQINKTKQKLLKSKTSVEISRQVETGFHLIKEQRKTLKYQRVNARWTQRNIQDSLDSSGCKLGRRISLLKTKNQTVPISHIRKANPLSVTVLPMITEIVR
jgi:hypothetical protein